jgi:hypothetical protein
MESLGGSGVEVAAASGQDSVAISGNSDGSVWVGKIEIPRTVG